MIQIKKYSKKSKHLWNDFISESKNGLFMFKRDYMDYHSDRFTDYSLMFYNEKNELIALLPANISNDILYSHQGLTFGGIVSSFKMNTSLMLDIFDVLKRHLKENDINKLIYKAVPHIYHKLPSEEDLYALFVNKAKLFRVDATTTIELNNRIPLSTLRKRGIKKAEKENIVVRQSFEFSEFVNLLNINLQDRHGVNAVHSATELELLSSTFPENIKLYVAENQKEMLAGVVIFEYDNIVHSQYITASGQGRKTGALDLLFSFLIKEVFDNKQYFDFGISTENQGLYLNKGLISQKEGFGGRGIIHQFFEVNI